MIVKIEAKVLKDVISKMQQFIEKKDESQMTSHIYFEAKNNTFIVKATNNETGLSVDISDVEIELDGIVTANGKRLSMILKGLKNEEVVLEAKDDCLFVKQQMSVFKLPSFNPKHYPAFPLVQDNILDIDYEILLNGIDLVSPTIDINNPKFELNGVLIDIIDEDINIVGTDTRRLAIVSFENQSNKEISIIIPKKSISKISKIFDDITNVYLNDTVIVIENDDVLFFSRLINGNFPNYLRIIPKDFKYKFKLQKIDIMNAIKIIISVSDAIKIIFNHNSILFKSLSSDNIEAKTEIKVDTPLNGFELNVNSRYILDFISQITSNYFDILLNESTLPFMVKDRNFKTIIMPIIT